ncbi:hypothetical protein HK102_004503, partial [Quaeritorhiza haematococci]
MLTAVPEPTQAATPMTTSTFDLGTQPWPNGARASVQTNGSPLETSSQSPHASSSKKRKNVAEPPTTTLEETTDFLAGEEEDETEDRSRFQKYYRIADDDHAAGDEGPSFFDICRDGGWKIPPG